MFRLSRTYGPKINNDYLFSAKGKIDYVKLEISEFVGGFLEFLNSQPESAQQHYLVYLKLLMERAATYSWYSVLNFHFSINTAVEAAHLSLQQFDQIKDRAQTFFTHADLPPAPTTPRVSTMSSQVRNSKKDTYCKEWNYTGKCNGSLPKRHTREFTIAVFAMQTTQSLAVSPARPNQKTKLAPNFSGACIPIQSNFNLTQFDFYFEHYQEGIIVDFLFFMAGRLTTWGLYCPLPFQIILRPPRTAFS